MATEIDRSAGLSASTAIKGPVLVATTGNVTLSGEQTIDGVACVEGDRVLARSQTDSAQNGIYLVSTGVWSRTKDFSRNNDVRNGTMVYVAFGSTLAGKIYAVSSPDTEITIDTSTITWMLIFTAGLGSGDMLAANNLSDVANVATARSNLGAAPLDSPTFTTLARAPTETTAENSTKIATTAFVQSLLSLALAALSLGTAATLAVMTAAQYLANTASKVLTTDTVWSAAGIVTLTDAATIAVDMNTFINATVTLGGSRALGAPTNAKVGQCGTIWIVQDGTGSRTMTFNSVYKFPFGSDPALSTAASSVDALHYLVRSSTFIECSLAKGLA